MKVGMRAVASTPHAPWKKKESLLWRMWTKKALKRHSRGRTRSTILQTKGWLLLLPNTRSKDSLLEKLTESRRRIWCLHWILKDLVQLWAAWAGHPRHKVELVQMRHHEGVWQVRRVAESSVGLTTGVCQLEKGEKITLGRSSRSTH